SILIRLFINLAKPYLVLINPKSGSGNALNGFNFEISPIWKQMNVPYELFCTVDKSIIS
ncbi:uncharacterized protein DC041_0001621, partial [Schistosoma bovis]